MSPAMRLGPHVNFLPMVAVDGILVFEETGLVAP